MIRIAGYELNSVVDGPGVRNTVFFQGCSHNCPGCHNPQTHDMSGGTHESIKNIVERLFSTFTMDEKPRITVSGGDPFCQERELAQLCCSLKYLRPESDIWVYTGFLWEDVYSSTVIPYINVLVDGPFIKELKSLEVPYRGSTNQRLVDCRGSFGSDRVVLWEPPADPVPDSSVLGWLEKAEEGDIHYGRKN